MNSTGERFIPGLGGTVELEHLNRYYFVINQLDIKGMTVLDIASGEGYGSKILSQYADHVYGVDISTEAVEYAKEKYQSPNLQFIQGSADKIPLGDNSTDVVVSFETIEHHDKHTEMINEIKRVLKSDGILIISSPDKYNYSDLRGYKNEFHVKELYYEEFKALITANFSNVSFFAQKTFSGSIISLDDENNSYTKPVIVGKSGESHFIRPKYNMAVATNNTEYKIAIQVIMYEESEVAITKSDIESTRINTEEATILKLHKTNTWKVGNFILYPLKTLKKILKL
jgi:ubiquinone/menaquinone biosynthesis C-methylase UbiE